MTPAEFQVEALKTWTEPLRGTELGRQYLRLGLVSEIGEVAGVLKRIIRDGWPVEVWRPKLVNELGDVAWYAAVDLDEERRAEDCQVRFDPDEVLMHMELAMRRLVVDRMREADITWDEVFTANVAKLRDRQARGVINGEGDAR